MPAPFTVVTFIDQDGDEFPVRVQGTWTRAERPKLLDAASAILEDFIAKDELAPNEPMQTVRFDGWKT